MSFGAGVKRIINIIINLAFFCSAIKTQSLRAMSSLAYYSGFIRLELPSYGPVQWTGTL
jgi:hypothetical protein